jgi:hypothetical protein
MVSPQFEVLAVRPAPQGANYIAKVSFAFRPSEFEPIRVTRRVKGEKEWHTYTDAEIDGARAVRIRSAFLRRSEKGELYVQTSGVEVPWSVSRQVAEAAFQRLEVAEESA